MVKSRATGATTEILILVKDIFIFIILIRQSGKDGRFGEDLPRANDFLCAPNDFHARTKFPEHSSCALAARLIEYAHIKTSSPALQNRLKFCMSTFSVDLGEFRRLDFKIVFNHDEELSSKFLSTWGSSGD